MRHNHKAGDRLFVGYSGKKPCVVDPDTGEMRTVELFVAVLVSKTKSSLYPPCILYMMLN